jgi:hypothetical protein
MPPFAAAIAGWLHKVGPLQTGGSGRLSHRRLGARSFTEALESGTGLTLPALRQYLGAAYAADRKLMQRGTKDYPFDSFSLLND